MSALWASISRSRVSNLSRWRRSDASRPAADLGELAEGLGNSERDGFGTGLCGTRFGTS